MYENNFKYQRAVLFCKEQAKIGKGVADEASIKARYIAIGGVYKEIESDKVVAESIVAEKTIAAPVIERPARVRRTRNQK